MIKTNGDQITQSFYKEFNLPSKTNTVVSLEMVPSHWVEIIIKGELLRQETISLVQAESPSVFQEIVHKFGFFQPKPKPEPEAVKELDSILGFVKEVSILEMVKEKDGDGDCFGVTLSLLSAILNPENKDIVDQEEKLLKSIDPRKAITIQGLHSYASGWGKFSRECDKVALRSRKTLINRIQLFYKSDQLVSYFHLLNREFFAYTNLKVKKVTTIKGDGSPEEFYNSLQNFFLRNSEKIFYVHWNNPPLGKGHAVVLDLSRRRVFDPSCGFYKSKDLPSFLERVRELALRNTQFYPIKDFIGTEIRWIFHEVSYVGPAISSKL